MKGLRCLYKLVEIWRCQIFLNIAVTAVTLKLRRQDHLIMESCKFLKFFSQTEYRHKIINRIINFTKCVDIVVAIIRRCADAINFSAPSSFYIIFIRKEAQFIKEVIN